VVKQHFDKDAIRAAHPIESVVQRYGVDLKPAGRKNGGPVYKGHCPFHADRDPSFTVYAAQGRFYCYGCDAHGDVFAFVQQIERTDFTRALQILAGNAPPTIQLPRAFPKVQAELELDDGHFAVMQAAAELYHSTLVNPAPGQAPVAAGAEAFLRARGIAEYTIHHWRVGYAAGSQLARYLIHRGLDVRKAVEVGLIRPGGRGREHLRGRVTFPLTRDEQTVFLVGRALSDGHPKYLGLPISKPLYYDGTLPQTLERDRAIVVEGPLDVLTLWQWGYQRDYSLIGLVGTHLKADALDLFERFGHIFLALDADSRGMEAAQRLAAHWPDRARVLHLPAGCDVNDLAQRPGGRKAFARLFSPD
jgi:DNA primase